MACRVGVHIGECVGGIVGSDMQRYHLFGKLMGEVEVLEATAPVSRVQVSGPLKEAIDAELRSSKLPAPFEFEARGSRTLMTSKGEAHTCDCVGGPTFLVNSVRGAY